MSPTWADVISVAIIVIATLLAIAAILGVTFL